MNRAMVPMACLFDGVGRLRNWLYDHSWLHSHTMPKAIVSIGNLSMGGTGKTPLTALFLDILNEHGVRAATLSRGYGGRCRTISRVPSQGPSAKLAEQFGDEPTWLASRYPDVPVYVGRDRVAAARHILERESVAVILLDDAYQHRRIARNLNVLLIDATDRPSSQYLFPRGRLRENWYALQRAALIVLNKTNLSTAEALSEWREHLAAHVSAKIPIVETQYEIHAATDFLTGQVVTRAELQGQKVHLLSAIARPELFAQSVVLGLGVEILSHHRYADHHVFTSAQIAQAAKAASKWVVMSQKDATKLHPDDLKSYLDRRWLVTDLQVTCSASTRKKLYEMVVAQIR